MRESVICVTRILPLRSVLARCGARIAETLKPADSEETSKAPALRRHWKAVPQQGDSTMQQLDDTHDPARRSWVASANEHSEFPLQNLPLGVFSFRNAAPRGGVAIGDRIFDLRAAIDEGLFSG